MAWDYDNIYKDYPCQGKTISFENGSMLKVQNIFDGIPTWMHDADLVFVDPPWNLGNINTFYTKADMDERVESFEKFYKCLFGGIKEINPKTCYVEVGKEYLAEFLIEMKKIYKYVTFYNSSYYHRKENMCYVIRGSKKFKKPKLDYMDEEDIIAWICENEDYECIADLCMGRGLVAVNATKHKKKFVGTELNHKRLSVTIKKICDMGVKYNAN